ncbi:MAG TPA: phosphatase PAP2 family protein [Mycobacteriales bacterium]|nr:phosphatase PAP2 family protein [Mycobacteriales bacterium]
MLTRALTRVRIPIVRQPLWWLEVSLAALAYWAYAAVRDAHGASSASVEQLAFQHGRDVQHLERLLGVNVELPLQHALLHAPWMLRLLGGFYGSAHFVVTFGVLGYLLIYRRQDYARWRTCLLVTTGVAVALFALFPTAPPRLIPDDGVQDTLTTVGGLWSYNDGVLEHITDPFAAMPSLHLAWSCWVAAALASTVGASWRTWRRWLFALYPAAVTVTVIATGAHWVLDTLAGGALLAAVCLLDHLIRPARRSSGLHVLAPAPLTALPDFPVLGRAGKPTFPAQDAYAD